MLKIFVQMFAKVWLTWSRFVLLDLHWQMCAHTHPASSGSIDLALHICRGNNLKPDQCTVFIKWSKVALHSSRCHRQIATVIHWLIAFICSCNALCTFNTRRLLGSYHLIKTQSAICENSSKSYHQVKLYWGIVTNEPLFWASIQWCFLPLFPDCRALRYLPQPVSEQQKSTEIQQIILQIVKNRKQKRRK